MEKAFPFTYQGYRELIFSLRAHGYTFVDYYNWNEFTKPVIIRHDIDNSLMKALKLAKIESEAGVRSTYFVLLTSEFYNVFSARAQKCLRELICLGHTVGLHFDEKCYPASFGDPQKCAEHIRQEASILENVLDALVTVVSMHRPSREILEADLRVPGMVNSYGNTFFKEFKYLSDSRRCWREPVAEIIAREQFPKLHILTHPFWYYEEEKPLRETVVSFIEEGAMARYAAMKENIKNLDSIVSLHEEPTVKGCVL